MGGIEPSAYARAEFGDCLTSMSSMQADYLKLVRSCRIGVVTEGIHGSIPWKCAEYLAASRCVVSPEFCYQLSTPMRAGENYLSYADVDDCLSSCDRLLTDEHTARMMQAANWQYYRDYVKPAPLMRRLLHAALASSPTARKELGGVAG